MTDVTKIVAMIEEADLLRRQVVELISHRNNLLSAARAACPHPAVTTKSIPRDDEFGKQLPDDIRYKCAVCTFEWEKSK
jgi:hypothetical protein